MTSNFHRYFKCADSVPRTAPGRACTEEDWFLSIWTRPYLLRPRLHRFLPLSRHSQTCRTSSLSFDTRMGRWVLPFVPDHIAEGLLNEVYSNQMEPEYTRLGSHSAVRRIYYWGRPLLSLRLRSVLQRIKLRGKLKSPFPSWPVDRSVDKLLKN